MQRGCTWAGGPVSGLANPVLVGFPVSPALHGPQNKTQSPCPARLALRPDPSPAPGLRPPPPPADGTSDTWPFPLCLRRLTSVTLNTKHPRVLGPRGSCAERQMTQVFTPLVIQLPAQVSCALDKHFTTCPSTRGGLHF